jgi:hypothetical protein
VDGAIPAFYVTSLDHVSVQWSGFGLNNARAILCLGSDAGHCNVATLHDVTTETGQTAIALLNLTDSTMYATIRVVQDGKLACSSSSLALQVDATPPSAGVVRIGHGASSPSIWPSTYVGQGVRRTHHVQCPFAYTGKPSP